MINQAHTFPLAKRLLPILALITALALSIGCGTTSAAPLSRSLLEGVPCEPPCWFGLFPERSTVVEIRQKLTELKLVNEANIKENRSESDLRLFWHRTGTGSLEGIFVTSNNILRYMIFYPDKPIKLRDIFAKFDRPERVFIQRDSNRDKFVYVATLFYPSHGLEFEVEFVPPKDNSQVAPSKLISIDIPITLVKYRRPMSLAELKNFYLSSGIQYIVDQWQDWDDTEIPLAAPTKLP